MAREDAFVHSVDDETDIAVQRGFPTLREDRLAHPWQIGISENRNAVRFYPGAEQGAIRLAAGVDRLVDQQAGAVQAGNDAKGNHPGTADGKRHRKAGQDASKEAQEHDDQADLDAIKSKQHQCVPS